MQKMMLRIKFRYAFYGKTEHSFESGIMKIKVIQRDTEVQMKEIKLKAMAKINLGLDVTRKREDGYHEVRMIMQSINMYDQIRLSPLEEPQIRVKTNVSFLPVNEDNLVYKAAKLLMDEFQVTSGVEIDLRKFIPTAAGNGWRKFGCGSGSGRCEPYVSAWTDQTGTDGAFCGDRCGCTVLCAAWNGTCGRNR